MAGPEAHSSLVVFDSMSNPSPYQLYTVYPIVDSNEGSEDTFDLEVY